MGMDEFYGHVVEIRMQNGRSNVECLGPVSLQQRPENVTLRCAWYEQILDMDDIPSDRRGLVPSFILGASHHEWCKCIFICFLSCAVLPQRVTACVPLPQLI